MRNLLLTLSVMIASLFYASLAVAAELVMIEQTGCHWCAKWNAEIGGIYEKTDEGKQAPLRRVDIHQLPEDLVFLTKPVFTPTFILMQEGHELARIEGYPGEDFFWPMLNQLIDQHIGPVPQL